MSIYTKEGDKGMTDMLSGIRVVKNDQPIQVLGHIDELTSHLGFVRSILKDQELEQEIQGIQEKLIDIMATISNEFNQPVFLKVDVEALENHIDRYQKMYPKLKGFVTPGDDEVSARFDIARAITRRVERSIVELMDQANIELEILSYFNRLSDYLYTLARMVGFREKVKSVVVSMVDELEEVVVNRLVLDLNLAKRIAEQVEIEAAKKGCQVVITIVNKDGTPMLVHVMDDTLLISFSLAKKKAYTSAALKMPTHELARLTQKGASLEGLESMVDEEIITLGGGYPLICEEKIIGAIGVSGSTVNNDIYLAEYGAKYIERVKE